MARSAAIVRSSRRGTLPGDGGFGPLLTVDLPEAKISRQPGPGRLGRASMCFHEQHGAFAWRGRLRRLHRQHVFDRGLAFTGSTALFPTGPIHSIGSVGIAIAKFRELLRRGRNRSA